MFATMLKAGQIYKDQRARVMNRSGAAVAVGDVLALDMLGTDAATAAGSGVGVTGLDVADAIFHNAVAVAAGNIDGIIVVVKDLLGDGGADDTQIEVALLAQRIQVEVETTTDVAIGDRLIPVAAQTYLVKQTDAADYLACAYALEAKTADSAALIDCLFFGGVLGRALLGD